MFDTSSDQLLVQTADVMADALVAEKAKLEPPSQQGVLQSTCYAYRFFFLMVGWCSHTLLREHDRYGLKWSAARAEDLCRHFTCLAS